MQEEAEKKSLKSKLSSIRKASGLSWRARSQPEASEQLATLLEEDVGAPESVASSIKEIIAAWREARLDDETFLHIDRYPIGGIGVVDLIRLQVNLRIGTSDPLSFVALLALVISLPLTSGSLFFSFLKQGSEITTYGNYLSTLSMLSLLAGVTAMTALIWHVSRLDGTESQANTSTSDNFHS